MSVINFFRSDKPESPTDLIFVLGGISLIALQIAAFKTQQTIPHFSEMLIALGTYKTVKIASNYQKKAKVTDESTSVAPQSPAVE